MERNQLDRLSPLSGVLFLLLAVVSFIFSGEAPSNDDSTAKIVDYWSDDTKIIIGALLQTLAALTLIWFGASLRDAIARVEGGTHRLATLAFAGTIVAGVGIATDAALEFAAADAATEAPSHVIESLNALYNGFFFPMALGFGLLLVATGLAILRTGVFPRWLGWILVVVWIVCFTPVGFFVILATMVLVAILGVVLFRRASAGGPPTTPPPGPPPS